jgi:hypothetical protein
MFQTPGAARELVNFESAQTSGYRSINGYERFGTQPNGDNPVLGVFPYADGVVACVGENIYFSTDGTTWLTMNVAVTDALEATLTAATPIARVNQGRCNFALYTGNTPYGELIVLDGVNNMHYIKIVGDGVSRQYSCAEITSGSIKPLWAEVYKDRLVVAGDVAHPSTLFWSDAYDPTTFTGGTSGSIQFLDKLETVKVWRDNLFAFGRNTINQVGGSFVAGVAPADVEVKNVSRNIGCISGWSVQEAGGDVLWLAPDGIRTLAGTSNIDDIEMGTVSRQINPIIQNIVSSISTLDISSTVIRSKNQYRMFYTVDGAPSTEQRGIIGTFKIGQGGSGWEWSETQGMEISCISSWVSNYLQGTFNTNEVVLHGGYNGYIYQHDVGNTFDGQDITHIYTSPEIDYGDLGTLKSFHWIKLNTKIEGVNEDITLSINYDFSDSDTAQPSPYSLPFSDGFSMYGTAIYGVDSYSGVTRKTIKQNIEGSGYSNSFTFTIRGSGSPVSINGYYIRYYQGRVQ